MQDPWRQIKGAADRKIVAAHRLGLGDIPGHERHRRIEPQRLAKDIADETQTLDVLEFGLAIAQYGRDFGECSFLDIGGLGEQIERPGEGAR